jgi:hypothetical protein
MIVTGKICLSAILSTTNTTRSALEANPGLGGEKPISNSVTRAQPFTA